MDAYKLDDEVRAILPSLTKDEADELERQILDGLHVDALVVGIFDGQKILLDGYNRHEICTRHGIPIPTREKKLKSRGDALQWVINNQLGRRNLTDERRSYYRGLEYVSSHKTLGPSGVKMTPTTGDSLSGRTREKLAEKHDVSPKTIERDAAFAEAVDELPPKEKEAVLNGHAGMTKQEVIDGNKPILCERCKRVGARMGCVQCAELRKEERTKEKPKPAPKKSGKPSFDWKGVRDMFGRLARELDACAAVYGKCNEHTNALTALDKAITYFDQWKAKIK